MRYVSLVFLLVTTTAWSASVGPDGVDSLVTGLDGAGVLIGQAEFRRSSKDGYDSDGFSSSNTVPTGVYFQNNSGMAAPDNIINEHATLVAQQMIGTGLFSGVAPEADLHSIGISDQNDDSQVALALNRLALLSGGQVKAINMSFYGAPGLFDNSDGKSHTTQFVDWSARQHDVLYVVSWGNVEHIHDVRKPADNFNGITVAASERVDGGPYRRFSVDVNAPETDSFDAQRIDILAPGKDVLVLPWNEVSSTVFGTSYAAPTVVGTAALLQQYAQQQKDPPISNPRFVNSQRHQVMKAVILNSADKISGVHGSARTVVDRMDDDWTESEANSPFIPLDNEMGAGHLNARRAVEQLAPGEYDPGIVPKLGWDYGSIGFGQSIEYTLSNVSGYIAITLAWDRIVNHTGGTVYNFGDQFFPYADVDDVLNNLDIRLVGGPGGTIVFAESISPDQSLEHIFFDIQNAGEYKIVVQHNGGIGSQQNYALAWWNGDAATPIPGDYDKDGDVDSQDYDVWKSNFGSNFADADGNGDGIVDAADYTVWRDNLGAGSGSLAAVPEPTTAWLLMAGLVGLICSRRIRLNSSAPPTRPLASDQ